MAQNPLPPPPPSGGVLDGWLYLLWRRLTQSGQILWESITPGTSADVAAVVTDETGSPGSLVFSANPTLQGVNIPTGEALIGVSTRFDISPAGSGQYPTTGTWATSANPYPFAIGTFSNDTAGGTFVFLKSRGETVGTNAALNVADAVGSLLFRGADGTGYRNAAQIYCDVNGTVSTGIVPGAMRFLTANASGVLSEAMRITSGQVVTIGGPAATTALKVTPVASQARWVEVTGATSSTNPTIGVSGGILGITASVAVTGVVSTSGYTVATLPAGTVGQRAYVTDALTPAYGVAVAGGGAVTVPVFYNGAAWICA